MDICQPEVRLLRRHAPYSKTPHEKTLPQAEIQRLIVIHVTEFRSPLLFLVAVHFRYVSDDLTKTIKFIFAIPDWPRPAPFHSMQT